MSLPTQRKETGVSGFGEVSRFLTGWFAPAGGMAANESRPKPVQAVPERAKAAGISLIRYSGEEDAVVRCHRLGPGPLIFCDKSHGPILPVKQHGIRKYRVTVQPFSCLFFVSPENLPLKKLIVCANHLENKKQAASGFIFTGGGLLGLRRQANVMLASKADFSSLSPQK